MSTEELRQALFDLYGGFADKRLRNVTRNAAFAIDGRTARDVSASGELYSWFCQMLAFADDALTVRIVMRGSLPGGRDVVAWFAARGMRLSESGVEFIVTPSTLPDLADLASRIARGGASGGKSARLMAPRTAASLRQLNDRLRLVWKAAD